VLVVQRVAFWQYESMEVEAGNGIKGTRGQVIRLMRNWLLVIAPQSAEESPVTAPQDACLGGDVTSRIGTWKIKIANPRRSHLFDEWI
jgi:hypothetical protein